MQQLPLRRGFTMIELTMATMIFSVFMLIALGETNRLSRAAGASGRGSSELCAATRFAEQFRNDVRQAVAVRTRYSGRALLLHVNGAEILYYVALEDRRAVRWNETSKETSFGPFMEHMNYDVSGQMVHARWDCLAETEPQPMATHVGAEAPRVLILDTAVRSYLGKAELKR